MSKGQTKISWADYTFNPWLGCKKIAPACANCYAAEWAERFRRGRDLWNGNRELTSDVAWGCLDSYHAAAMKRGKPYTVFVASLADIFDDHPDVEETRQAFFLNVVRHPWLRYLLLTKRPQNAKSMVPSAWLTPGGWPANVAVGATAEDQTRLESVIPHLAALPAPTRFLSCEPLLGELELRNCLGVDLLWEEIIHWVIAGGESVAKKSLCRPTESKWARKIRDQCAAASVPFHFKQWGRWVPVDQLPQEHQRKARRVSGQWVWSQSKDNNVLDNRTYLEFPEWIKARSGGPAQGGDLQ